MITCILVEAEIKRLYTAVTALVEDQVKKDKPLNTEEIMKKIYDKLAKGHNPEKAAEFVQHVPRIIMDLLTNTYHGVIQLTPQAFGELYGTSTEFYSDNGIDAIIKRFTPKRRSKADVKAERKTQKRVNKKKETSDNLEGDPIPEETPGEKRYKAFTVFKGTIQEYLKKNPTTKRILVPEKADMNRVVMQSTLKRLAGTFDIDDDGLAAIKYQNKFLAVKAVSLEKFAKEYPTMLDETTMKEIARSEGMVNKQVASSNVSQTNERVILVIADNKNGKVLFFDEDGNIVTEKEGKPVYQFMYDVRKTNTGYTVTDIYGIESKIATPEVIAEQTYDPEIDGTLEEYTAKVRKAQEEDFKKLYDLKRTVLSGKDQLLTLEGVSEGLSSEINDVSIPLDQLRALGVDRKVFKEIETLKTPEAGIRKGAAVIKLNGSNFEVERPDLTLDIVDQIAEVLTNKKVPFKKRLDFAQQFLSNEISPTARRHTLVYDVDKKVLNLQVNQFATQEAWEFKRETTDPVTQATIKEWESKKTPMGNQRYKFYIIPAGTIIKGKTYDKTTYRLFEFNDSKGRGETTTLYLNDEALNGATPESLAQIKDYIKDALSRGYYQPKFERFAPTKMIYSSPLLDNGQYEVYDIATQKFVKKDYIDFLMNREAFVTIKTKDPGFYNSYFSFSIPTDADIVLETEEEVEPVFQPLNPFEVGVEETDFNRLADSIYKQLEEYGQSTEWINRLADQGIESNSANMGFYVANLLRQQFENNPQKVYTKELATAILDIFIASRLGTEGQRKFISRGIESLPFEVEKPSAPAISVAEIIEKTVVPGSEDPTNTNTAVAQELSKEDEDGGYDESELERNETLSGKTTRAQRRKAKNWWNNSETGKAMQEVIELTHLANLVNSNAFAEFTVAGATLLDDSKIGQIKINPLKGSMVDVYHEAFHVFTQLFLTRPEKLALYKSVKYYTDANGNQPYKSMKYLEIEEMLAEDYRTFAKDKTIKDNIPVKNTLFRKMLRFLKMLFSKVRSIFPVSKQDVVVDSSSIPVVAELFENLYFNKNGFLNNYKPLIENVNFNILNRGIPKVSNPREDALSVSDSDLIVSTIDSIISEEIDKIHDQRKDKGVTKSLKAGVINLLTSDTNRAALYKNIKETLEADLKAEKKKLISQPNATKFSELKTLEDIKAAAIGVMKNSKGEDKYIFLTSQIDDFSELGADIKKGARVKGEKYFDIPIVADFYVHKTIKSGKKTVDIMVVSKPSDAQVQYENYVKGGAKVFSEPVMKENIEATVLSQEQELILDNIRILQTAVDDFGDPQYYKEGKIPTGVIKYHLEKSRFTLLRRSYVDVEYDEETDYERDDEDDDLVDEFGVPISEEQELTAKSSDLTNDNKVGKYSLQQLADNSTLYILSSLFYVDAKGNTELDRFGHKKLSSFKDTWNIVAKSISGVQNPETMYDILNKLKNTYPILRQLVDYKLPNPKFDPERGMAITNSFEVDNIVGFWQTFRRPRIPYIQLMYFPKTTAETDFFSGEVVYRVTGYDSEVRYASVDGNTIIKRFQNEFAISPETEFISKINNVSILKLDAVIKKFSTKDGDLDTNKALQFARAIGIYLDNTEALEKTVKDNMNEYGIPYLFYITKDIKNLEDKLSNPDNKLSPEAIQLITDFKRDPIGTLKSKIPAALVPSVKAKKGVVEQKNIITKLAELNAKLGYETLNFGVKNANGDTVYENIDINSVFMEVNGLNSMETLDQAWTEPEFEYMSYLDPQRNAFTNRSILLNSMFNIETGMYDRRGDRTMELAMDDGTRIPNKNTGNTTGDLTPKGKLNQELTLMLKSGAVNMLQNADKKTTPIFRLLGGIIGEKSERGVDDHLYIDTDMFAPNADGSATAGELYAVNRVLIQNLAAEFDRIVMVKENRSEVEKIKGPNQIVEIAPDGTKRMAAEVFTAFDRVLTEETKEKLYELAEDWDGDIIDYLRDGENAKLWNDIQTEIINYFRSQVSTMMRLYGDFAYDKALDEKTGIPEVPADAAFLDEANMRRTGAVKSTLMTSFTYNTWVHNFETIHLFFGDISQFNHMKEELQKRDAGGTSGGLGFMNHAFFNNFINNVFNASVKNELTGEIVEARTYAAVLDKQLKVGEAKYDNFIYDGKLRTGVIADAERESVYLNEMVESWREGYEEDYKDYIKDPVKRKAFIDKLIEEDKDPYKKMTESDGAGYITIDAYRTIKKASNQWTYDQEQLYKKVIAGEKITQKDIKQFFPPYKLQYYGPLHDTVMSVVGMHKFALTPLVPGALGGAELQKLHEEMLRTNRQYMLFGSGSKVSTVTLTGDFDDIFLNKDQKAIKPEEDFQTAPNIIYVEYLKDVTSVNNKYKKKVTAGTQQRVMFIDNFYKDGELINPEENKEAVEGYIANTKNITNVLVAELLNEIGFVYKDGMYQASGNSIEKFVNTIKKGLGKKNVPQHLLNLVGVNTSGQATMDYSLHPIADDIEALATSLIQKRIINQKAKGEPLIQVPSTLYNGLWDAEFELVKDEEQIRKLLGTNNLPFVIRGKKDPKTGKYGPSSLMKVAITMQADFENLYQRLDLNGKKIAESADPLALLNQLIKKDEWLNTGDNRLAVSTTGPRIPTDAINLVEGAEVWHFFPVTNGNIVVVPTELVAKTGGDFDVDKLNLEFPYIDGDGITLTTPMTNAEFKKALTAANENMERLKKDKKLKDEVIVTPASIINAQKKALHNQSLQLRLDILRLPDTYKNLTKPNSTYLVEQYAELVSSAQPYQKLADEKIGNRVIRGYKINPKDGKKTVSPTRTLELPYNLHKFEVNLSSGGLTLGITAKQNKQHVLNNQIGNKMPASYFETVWKNGKYEPTKRKYLVQLHFEHNTTLNKNGEEVISLGGLQTKRGTRITSLNSHDLNGILDRAKKSFPGELNMVPETMPILNHLMEAGVDEEQALYFINLPLIKEYVNAQRDFADVYGKIRLTAPENSSMNRYQAANSTVENFAQRTGKTKMIENLVEQTNYTRLMNALSEVNKTTKLNVFFGSKVGFVEMKASVLLKNLQDKNFKAGTVRGVRLFEENVAPIFQEEIYKPSSSIVSTASFYYAKQFLFDKLFGTQDINFTTEAIKGAITRNDISSDYALAFLMHYIQIEQQIKGAQEAAALFSPDTSFVKTIQQVRKRQQRLEDLKKSGKIDEDLIDDFKNKSILGSFFIDELMLDTIEPLFPLRLDADISDFIEQASNNFSTTIASRFGAGSEGKERFSSMFNNAVVTALFQNQMSNFPDARLVDDDLMLPEIYKQKKISINDNQKEVIKIDKDVISINLNLAKIEFTNRYYLDSVTKPEGYLARGLFAFDSKANPFTRVIDPETGTLLRGKMFDYYSNYVRFIVDRELLRSANTMESLKDNFMLKDLKNTYQLNDKEAYEMYLAKKALMNSFNPAYIFGTSQFSYTEDVMNVINQFPILKQKFPITAQLAPQTRVKTDKNVMILNDRDATGEIADGYHNDLVQLADITINKSDTPEENKFITDIFKYFSLMMYFQHGLGYSTFGFVKTLDSTQYVTLMRTVGLNYIENPIDFDQLRGIAIELLDNGDIFKNYVQSSVYKRFIEDTVFEEYDEEDLLNELAAMNKKASNPLVQAAIDKIKAVETTNPYRAKDIDMFKEATAFIGFETTLNDPRLEAKSSTKLYRQAFDTIANKGTYSPTDVVALSGSGNFGRGGIDLTTAIQDDFKNKYKPEILKAIDGGVKTFLLGSYNDQNNLQDYYIQKYLESKGYTASTVTVGKFEYYKFTIDGGTQEKEIEPEFKNSLFRGQESQPVIDENGNLVMITTYDSLFKSEGISFAEDRDMAEGYGLRYSKNPYIVEIDADYADKIFPLDTKGGTKSYGKRVIGDEGEQRFVSKENIIIPKGYFKVHRKERTFDFTDTTADNLIEAYNKQFVEGDIAEYNRYGEAGKGYATEGSDYYQAIEKELLRRGVTKEELPFLQTPNGIISLEDVVASVFNIKAQPGELVPEITQEQIKKYQDKHKQLVDKLSKPALPAGRQTAPLATSSIDFQENQAGGYPARTKINASADATIHLGDNFETPGEKLTRKSVEEQDKIYIKLATTDRNLSNLNKESLSAAIRSSVDILNKFNAKTLNIAGNGIYDMKGRTQEEVDEFTYTILSGIVNSPDLKNKITSIRSGGQTGFDEAGAKAGVRLGIPTIVLAPKDWEFRTNQGNFKDEAAFKARFDNVKSPSTKTSIEPQGDVIELEPGLDYIPNALSTEEQEQFFEFGKEVLEKNGYNPFPAYVMASAGQMEWSPLFVVDKEGNGVDRSGPYNESIVQIKKQLGGRESNDKRWNYNYYLNNFDGTPIMPIPNNIISILEKITGQDMSDYDTVLINLYPIGRTLGWHQDITEDYRTMDRDIISVSIGADADFTYNNAKGLVYTPKPGTKSSGTQRLSSGDVMVFGGESRLVQHTVTNVQGTTDLGQINLTNSNVNKGFKGGLMLDNWRMNFTFRVASAENNNGKRASEEAPQAPVTPGTQLTLFDENAPEGLPPSKRSSKKCNN